MKTFYTTAPLLLFFAFADAQLKTLTLKGKVKSVITYGYDWSQNITSSKNPNWFWKVEILYDNTGKIINETALLRKLATSRDFDTLRNEYNKGGRLSRSYIKANDITEYSYATDSLSRISVTAHHQNHSSVFKLIDDKAGTETIYASENFRRVFEYHKEKSIRYVTEIENGNIQSKIIEKYDDQDRKVDQVVLKHGVRKSHEITKYSPSGYTRIDSNLTYIGGPPAKIIGDKLTSFTYKYLRLDKQGNPLITAFLHGNKYIIIEVAKIEYY